jgi:PAS domain S-box-containing protein
VGDSEDVDEASVSSGSTLNLKTCHCEGAIGIPEGHPAAPIQVDLKRSLEGFVPAFREAMRTREPTLLHTRDGTLPEELLEGVHWRGFGDPCDTAIIFPLRPTNGDMILAFLLIGINPRRPYDDGYKAFTSLLNRQVATSLASFMLFEEEVRRNRDAAEAAALESKHLTQQLALQTDRLRRMTELSPLGMFLVSPEGVLREGNDRYYEMTGHPRDNAYEMSWMEQIMESSKSTMRDGWHRMAVDRSSWTGELQLKKLLVTPVDLNGEAIDYWVMVNAQPEFASDGSIRSIMGSITDISHLKWAQGLQNRRLQEAEETRRQQNEFIDITSHEMRNPLSAILQCADDILSTLSNHRVADNPPNLEAVESCLEAAQTISLCVQHQKSIVDDILTVSKLDSNLLVITPVASQPIEVVKRAVKMFDPELQAKDIEMICEAHPSFKELEVDWVTFDPSRVLQILINLM